MISRARNDSTGTAWTTIHRRPLSGGEQRWSSADGRTPPEIIAALHEALATTLLASPHDLGWRRPQGSGRSREGVAFEGVRIGMPRCGCCGWRWS
ncbi:DUF317 domain-containing protein [Kitasatospora sp. NPDC097605]|uniref:DUF317 domain-containing protein n=1 Tax=Kitasatospora sp. NPDC097605 TaxID=3157226 RepID=UPI00331AEFCF